MCNGSHEKHVYILAFCIVINTPGWQCVKVSGQCNCNSFSQNQKECECPNEWQQSVKNLKCIMRKKDREGQGDILQGHNRLGQGQCVWIMGY